MGTIWMLLGLLLLACPAHAGVFYLNPATGADSNPGTAAAPWKTLNKVASSVEPGDTVTIQAGTYTPSQYVQGGGWFAWTAAHRHGTPGHPITVQAEGTVIFDGGGTSLALTFGDQGSDPAYYVVIKGIEFRNYPLAIAIGNADGNYRASYVAVLHCTARNTRLGVLGTARAHHIIAKGNQVYDTLSHANYIAEGTEWLVFDQNYHERIGYYGFHGYGHIAEGQSQSTLAHWIVRRNIYVDVAWYSMVITGSTDIHHIYLYNNTLVQDPVMPASVVQSLGQADGYGAVAFRLSATYTGPVVVQNTIGAGAFSGGVVAASNGISTLQMHHNDWRNTRTGARFEGATYDQASLNADPRFTNAAGRDFTLQPGSPAIDTGTFLTTAVTSGSGTTLRVQDAGYFHDGYGLVAGDVIQLEGGTAAQVTAVDYGSNTLTLATALSWRAGQGVALRYTGARPDMGAKEVGMSDEDAGSGPPVLPAPYNLRVTRLPR